MRPGRLFLPAAACILSAACAPDSGDASATAQLEPDEASTPRAAATEPTPRAAPPAPVPGAVPAARSRLRARVERVVDGDTLVTAGGERVRLLGIDTPELDAADPVARSLARDAARALRAAVASGRIELVAAGADHRDRYDRLLAYVHPVAADGAPGPDAGQRLLAAGQARIFPVAHPRLERYLAVQARARAAGRGLWSAEGQRALGLAVELEIPASRAREHVGRRARVTGRVVDVVPRAEVTFVNFAEDWRTGFSGVVFARQAPLFPDDLEAAWEGRLLELTGRIQRHEGRPEIVLRSPDQVRVVEGGAAPE